MAKKTIESEIDFNKEALRYYKGYLILKNELSVKHLLRNTKKH